ncbi:2-oxoacid:acceptor oxidoreductase subunit alpha [Methanospirillum stamsii]|uniref:Pyruvate ferredoxin oxidoreductase n=1 Tax=Methanospirillum stamsii TaxID=1277351 RepID=A0A2V2NL89_9EURY|nr:2-oxoacid:acceptor oxidoreductase subunit alpha [Methanospirillum stamsii]PWR76093.1 pyruvate ferredoxin oxidoreductase [Methanospirillum stamsii]
MTDFSVLIGGKAGDGISQAGQIIGSVFASMGYHVYQYTDYPSLIRGGHNFCIIRAADHPVTAFRSHVDVILAFDQQTVNFHSHRLVPDGEIIFDSNRAKAKGIGVSLASYVDRFQGLPIMGNTAMIGALSGYLGISWEVIEPVLTKKMTKKTEDNLKIARAAFDEILKKTSIDKTGENSRPFMSGNEWIGLGLLAGGLDAYVAYPMTPSSGVLHFLADVAKETDIIVYHPESEIAVILMAMGLAYAGKKTAIGTSGGGFCLMTEGLSFAGQAEIPVVIIVSQRTGPSTGLPTYTGQSDLLFVRHAGQGEFPRWIAAPATPSEAFRLSAMAVKIAWKFQIPAFILSDKSFSEGIFTGDINPGIPDNPVEVSPSFPYRRYEDAADGISPILAPPVHGEVIKVNSYTHDFRGITTEDPGMTVTMAMKRKKKNDALKDLIDNPENVCISGKKDATICIVCWGSVRGQVTEAANDLDVRIVSPLILEPFPIITFQNAMKGVTKLLVVEESANGQIDKILKEHGFFPDELLLRCDGRPSTVEELQEKIRRHI